MATVQPDPPIERTIATMLIDAITGDTHAKDTVDDTMVRVGYICEQLGVRPTEPLADIKFCLEPLKEGR